MCKEETKIIHLFGKDAQGIIRRHMEIELPVILIRTDAKPGESWGNRNDTILEVTNYGTDNYYISKVLNASLLQENSLLKSAYKKQEIDKVIKLFITYYQKDYLHIIAHTLPWIRGKAETIQKDIQSLESILTKASKGE